MTLVTEYLKWRKLPPVGCMFARMIAVRPRDYGQVVEVVPSSSSPNQVAGNIARRVDNSIEDRSVAAVALLLPGLSTLEGLTRAMLALGERPHWSVTPVALPNTPVGDLVAVHIVREIPFGDTTSPSEALVLGDFDPFPATRRSPISALEMYVGEPRPNDPKTGDPTKKANLAHLDTSSGLQTQAQFDKVWQKSQDGRATSLGGIEDNRAKAKVAFVIPTDLAEQLGCVP